MPLNRRPHESTALSVMCDSLLHEIFPHESLHRCDCHLETLLPQCSAHAAELDNYYSQLHGPLFGRGAPARVQPTISVIALVETFLHMTGTMTMIQHFTLHLIMLKNLNFTMVHCSAPTHLAPGLVALFVLTPFVMVFNTFEFNVHEALRVHPLHFRADALHHCCGEDHPSWHNITDKNNYNSCNNHSFHLHSPTQRCPHDHRTSAYEVPLHPRRYTFAQLLHVSAHIHDEHLQHHNNGLMTALYH